MRDTMWEKMIGLILKITISEPWEYYNSEGFRGIVAEVKGESILIKLNKSLLVRDRAVNYLLAHPRMAEESIRELIEGKGISVTLEIIWSEDENPVNMFGAAIKNRGFQGFSGTIKMTGRKKITKTEMDDLKRKRVKEDKQEKEMLIKYQANKAWLEKDHEKAYKLYAEVRNTLSVLEAKRYAYLKKRIESGGK